jgi:hypothetical protein
MSTHMLTLTLTAATAGGAAACASATKQIAKRKALACFKAGALRCGASSKLRRFVYAAALGLAFKVSRQRLR